MALQRGSMGGFSLQQPIAEVKSFASAIKNAQSEFERVTQSELKTDEAGKAFQATIKGIARDGRELTVVLREMKSGIDRVASVKLKEQFKGMGVDEPGRLAYWRKIGDIDRNQQVVLQNEMKARFEKYERGTFALDQPTATRAQQGRANLARQNLIMGMVRGKDNGGYELADVQRVMAQMQNHPGRGFVRESDVKIARELSVYIKAAEDAERGFANQAAKVSKEMAHHRTIMQRTQEGKDARNWMLGPQAFGPDYLKMAAKDPRAAMGSMGYMNRLQGMVQAGKITQPDLESLYKQWKGGAIPRDLDAIKAKAVQAFQQIHIGLTKGSQLAVPFYERMQGIYHVFLAYIGIRWYQYIVEGFRNATEAAADFHRQIALVQTITQDSGLQEKQWFEGFTNIAKKGSFGPDEVAAAGYDLLSNQITKSADTFVTLGEAQDFARVTGGKLTDAVDTLSSSLNAFQTGTDQTNSFLSKFFVTIDLGRVKVEELGKTIGRLNTYAKNVGLSINESLGGISLLTRKGIQPETAQTLLLNVYQKLLNPTEKMQKFLDEAGYRTGDNLVKTEGWVGALQKLYAAAHGSASEIADMFGEIRGSQGAMILMKNMKELISDISAHANAGAKYDISKNIVNQNVGQKLYDEYNKLKTYITTEFKDSVLNTIINITDGWGGFANVIQNMISLAAKLAVTFGSLMAVGKGFSIFKNAKEDVKQQLGALNASSAMGSGGLPGMFTGKPSPNQNIITDNKARRGLNALGGTNIGSVLLTALDVALAVKLYEEIEKIQDFFENAPEMSRKFAAELRQLEIKELNASVEKFRTSFEEALTNVDKNLRKIDTGAMRVVTGKLADLKVKSEEAGKAFHDSFEVLLSVMRKIADFHGQQSNTAAGGIKSSKENQDKLQMGNFEARFQARIQQNERDKSNAEAIAQAYGGYAGDFGADQKIRYYKDYEQHIVDEKARIEEKMSKTSDVNVLSGQMEKYKAAQEKHRQLLTQGGAESYSTPIGYGPDGSLIMGQAPLMNQNRINRGVHESYQDENSKENEYQARLDEIKKREADRQIAAMQKVKQVETKMGDITKFSPFDTTGKVKKEYESEGRRTGKTGLEVSAEKFDKLNNDMKKFIEDFARANQLPLETEKELGRELRNATAAAIKSMQERATIVKQEEIFKSHEKALTDFSNKFSENIDRLRSTLQDQINLLAKKQGEAQAGSEKYRTSMGQVGKSMVGEEMPGMLGSMVGGYALGTQMPEKLQDLILKTNVAAMGAKTGPQFENAQKMLEESRQRTGIFQYLRDQGQTNISDDQIEQIRKTGRRQEWDRSTGEMTVNEKVGPEEIQRGLRNFGPGAPGERKSFDELFGQAKAGLTERAAAVPEAEHVRLQISDTQAQLDLLGNSVKQFNGILQTGIVPLQNIVEQLGKFSEKLSQVNPQLEFLKAGEKATQERSGEKPAGRLGGLVRYFAEGGSVGTDTIPAMLGPNEFVMNSQATGRFYSQLQDMNAGLEPDRTEKSSMVPNVNIHMNVNGADTSKQSVSEIASGLQRAINLGSVRLKPFQ